MYILITKSGGERREWIISRAYRAEKTRVNEVFIHVVARSSCVCVYVHRELMRFHSAADDTARGRKIQVLTYFESRSRSRIELYIRNSLKRHIWTCGVEADSTAMIMIIRWELARRLIRRELLSVNKRRDGVRWGEASSLRGISLTKAESRQVSLKYRRSQTIRNDRRETEYINEMSVL